MKDEIATFEFSRSFKTRGVAYHPENAKGPSSYLSHFTSVSSNRCLRPAIESNQLLSRHGTPQKVFHSYAIAAAHMGKHYVDKSNEALAHAAQIYRHCGTYPFGFRANFWAKEKQIHALAQDRGVAKINLIPTIPADIDAAISRVAKWLAKCCSGVVVRPKSQRP